MADTEFAIELGGKAVKGTIQCRHWTYSSLRGCARETTSLALRY